MAERPRVGVTGNSRRWSPSWWSTRLALRLAGAQAERISVRHAASGRPLSALIIGGGDDIGPEHYGGEITAKVRSDPERDELEMRWIERALEQGIPLLGICRGAQLINVVLGGNLHQDIRAMRVHTYNRPGLLPTKQVRVDAESRLAGLCGKARLRVNSLHHQAVRQPGEGLRVVAWDLDNIVQAVEAADGRPIIGVQWHPEYLCYLPAQLALFRWLIRSAA
ncbi:gamma-glutamyl-gamma-aminobutyrate hydrolase family protein [Pseudomonas sp. LPB0260]|uniref:gamma-glutamyl-gamma-aminobutyrate hydrolase family protein n=1 Tax=Pseudomonas sp. LPB0260 TaxID=2614442 RepID=UPI0015C264F1|nr:gamma-glutamyl-gamma-aminobutyrate hydrolase family protein [Pseudomonas sp. LPB0260]QLC74149.1 gamma-glutamyl-gamma-aminobutyrate hydrolase family protein [Pseudomonas sp. LPB0260]QLC76920.1 gamma-glutamyl-gamma-aminobutyrate hydrolase family protein [Pseudomonas sp. LPB0260]